MTPAPIRISWQQFTVAEKQRLNPLRVGYPANRYAISLFLLDKWSGAEVLYGNISDY